MTIKPLVLLTAAAMLAATPALVQAQNAKAPGQMMQEKGSVKGEPGASGYAPGTQMKAKGSVKGTTGASGYAPGHATTGASTKTDVDVKSKAGVKAKVGVDAGAKVDAK